MGQCFAEGADVCELERAGRRLPQHLLDETGVSGIVLHQQELDGAIGGAHLEGSRTTPNQKLSMDCTTERNWSRPTGLVR